MLFSDSAQWNRQERQEMAAVGTLLYLEDWATMGIDGALEIYDGLMMMVIMIMIISLSQWLNFKLSGIACLVGKLKFKLLSSGSIGWVSNDDDDDVLNCCIPV